MNSMIAAINIRQACSDDSSTLSGIIRESFRDVAERFGLTSENCPKHPSNYTREWIDNDFTRGVIYYLLERDGTPAGCVALEISGPDLCYLERLAVLPGSRRKGYSKALVEYIFSQAKALGKKQISIGIISEQTDLKLWYQKIGFVEGHSTGFSRFPVLVAFMKYEL